MAVDAVPEIRIEALTKRLQQISHHPDTRALFFGSAATGLLAALYPWIKT